MYIIRAQKTEGYHSIVEPTSGSLKLLSFGTLDLEPGQSYEATSGREEKVLILLQGSVRIEVEGQQYEGSRENVFASKATAVYVGAQSSFRVLNTGNTPLRVALCGTPAPEKMAPFMVKPDEVWSRTVGKESWEREVHDIVVKNAEGRVHRIIVGETFNQAGKWSSYPPHKHDHYEPGVEAEMEEVYYYQLNPEHGFGVQAIYTTDGSIDEAYRVLHGDTFVVPKGYHPVCAAGGYQLYYLWMMAGTIDRVMIPHDDPTHAWLK